MRDRQVLTIDQLDQIDLDKVTRPGLKSLAPGTLDNAVAINNCVKLGVSCSLWKGSSGGPCFLLNEVGAGAIIGHGKMFFSSLS